MQHGALYQHRYDRYSRKRSDCASSLRNAGHSQACRHAAWGISRGRFGGNRDAPRMKQFPLSAGAKYHRGHAIPHRLGGPLDINLVPQLGAINIGPFRALEKRAMATPGALYFTFWTYRGASQTPVGVDQGLLVAGKTPEIASFGN
jgi:hypothetical protein